MTPSFNVHYTKTVKISESLHSATAVVTPDVEDSGGGIDLQFIDLLPKSFRGLSMEPTVFFFISEFWVLCKRICELRFVWNSLFLVVVSKSQSKFDSGYKGCDR